jgi:hypothetical protein
MNEKLIVVAQRWSTFGLRTDAVQDLGDAIQHALQTDLQTPCSSCKNNDWTNEMGDAWSWAWNLVSRSIVNTLKSMEAEYSGVVRASWEVSPMLCVCVCVCVCVIICVCVYIYIYIYININVCVGGSWEANATFYLCVYVSCVRLCLYVVNVWKLASRSMVIILKSMEAEHLGNVRVSWDVYCASLCACTCVCTLQYTYVCVYTYIHIYIVMYIIHAFGSRIRTLECDKRENRQMANHE